MEHIIDRCLDTSNSIITMHSNPTSNIAVKYLNFYKLAQPYSRILKNIYFINIIKIGKTLYWIYPFSIWINIRYISYKNCNKLF